MKYIKKSTSEPISLSSWKKRDKMFQRQKAKWKRFSNPDKKNFIKDLAKEQGYICCYCEQKINLNDCHIEHLLPQKLDIFSEKLFDYNNLLCSCQKDLEKGEPRHCGNSKGSRQIPIIPLENNCEIKFKYTEDGQIEHTCSDSKETIKILQLDIDKLNDLRRNAIEPFIIDPVTFEEISKDDAKKFANEYLKLKNGKFNEFYTTIKYLFG